MDQLAFFVPTSSIMDPKLFFLFIIVLLSSNSVLVSCNQFYSRNTTRFLKQKAFSQGIATWYGAPEGAGSGGACGYGGDDGDVAQAPFFGKIAAGNQNLFKNGKGCGSCYSIVCNENQYCSGKTIRITITDECPGACNNDAIHFDLSGKAFGLLAKSGKQDLLRKAGRINILYRRVPCSYSKQKIVFKVDKGSNQYYFSTAVEYENGDGNIGKLEIKPAGSNQFFPMQKSFGATYTFDVKDGVKPPFSIRITQIESKRSIVAYNVIPVGWKPGSRYTASVNF